MREQEEKLAKVRKSCDTAKKITKGFKILFIVCSVLCLLSAVALYGLKSNINESIIQTEKTHPGSFELNIDEIETGILSLNLDEDEIIASGTYAESFALMCAFAAVVCAVMAVIFGLIQKIFVLIDEEGSPFGEKVLAKIKRIFIAIAVIVGLEVGLGIGLFLGLFFWCLYCIMDYGSALQKEVDETL